MEQKKPWNLAVFKSVAEAFDGLATRAHRGDKGVTVNAALLMFLSAEPADRQRYIDLVKLAEGRGLEGTVLQAAQLEIDRRRAKELVAGAREVLANSPPAHPARRQKGRG
jgi:hypothetical protein